MSIRGCLPGLEPGISSSTSLRVNQLHHRHHQSISTRKSNTTIHKIILSVKNSLIEYIQNTQMLFCYTPLLAQAPGLFQENAQIRII